MYVESIIVGLLTVVICWYIRYTWNRRRLYELASKMPGPKGTIKIALLKVLLKSPIFKLGLSYQIFI